MVVKQFKSIHCGDARAIIKYKDGCVEKLDNPNETIVGTLDNDVLKCMREISESNNQNVLDAIKTEKIQRMLKENRARKNTEGGYWILGTNTEAVAHGVLFEKKAEKIESVILHSDGFNYEILGISLEKVVEQCKNQKDLEDLQRRIREAEKDDPYGNKQPRFKQGDDMTVITDLADRIPEIDVKLNVENEDMHI